jgi:hypothetical protein
MSIPGKFGSTAMYRSMVFICATAATKDGRKSAMRASACAARAYVHSAIEGLCARTAGFTARRRLNAPKLRGLFSIPPDVSPFQRANASFTRKLAPFSRFEGSVSAPIIVLRTRYASKDVCANGAVAFSASSSANSTSPAALRAAASFNAAAALTTVPSGVVALPLLFLWILAPRAACVYWTRPVYRAHLQLVRARDENLVELPGLSSSDAGQRPQRRADVHAHTKYLRVCRRVDAGPFGPVVCGERVRCDLRQRPVDWQHVDGNVHVVVEAELSARCEQPLS